MSQPIFRPFSACLLRFVPRADAPSTSSGQALGCILVPLRGFSLSVLFRFLDRKMGCNSGVITSSGGLHSANVTCNLREHRQPHGTSVHLQRAAERETISANRRLFVRTEISPTRLSGSRSRRTPETPVRRFRCETCENRSLRAAAVTACCNPHGIALRAMWDAAQFAA